MQNQWFEMRLPDERAYEEEKKLSVIKASYKGIDNVFMPDLPKFALGNGCLKGVWREYYGPRLGLSISVDKGKYLTRFPGHIVPGPGANKNTVFTGSLMIEKYIKLLGLGGAFPAMGIWRGKTEQPNHVILEMESVGMVWQKIPQPKIKVIHPEKNEQVSYQKEIGELLQWMSKRVSEMIGGTHIQAENLLRFIRFAWSSHTRSPNYAPESIMTAECLIRDFVRENPNNTDWLAFAFELEAVISTLEYSWPLHVFYYGVFNGTWVEVGRLPIEKIQCTELVQIDRLKNELVNIRMKGFAPIVINEYGCDTDGTHRIVAGWMWNLLKEISPVIDHGPGVIENSMKAYLDGHDYLMGLVVRHEILRSLGDIMLKERDLAWLKKEVLAYSHEYKELRYLPVILLPEYSCGAVIKDYYDRGVASYRVCPSVYEKMAVDKSLVLPARGPYHLTDRALLPWFQVLEKA